MKRDIRSFKSAKESAAKEKASEILDGIDENTKREAEAVKSSLRQFEGKSQQELMAELTKMAEAQRKAGSLNDEKLDAFARSVSPMLNQEQRKRLACLVKQLKK